MKRSSCLAFACTLSIYGLGLTQVHAQGATGVGAAPGNMTGGLNTVIDATADVETLQRQLAAQRAINEQLKQRVSALERELSAGTRSSGPIVVSLDPTAPKARYEAVDAEGNTAIEQALVSKGLVLLPPGTFRITPSLSWARSGSGNNSFKSTSMGISLEAGMPWGMSASMGLPYIKQDLPGESNRGIGDLTVSLAKRLNNETDSIPSFVARGSYTHDSGDDLTSSGFRSYRLSLSGIKRFDPLVVYGDISYGHSFAKTLNGNRIKPGDSLEIGFGVSLAATPDVSLDLGVSLTRVEKTKVQNAQFPSRDIAYIDLGAGIVLTKNLFLALTASAGITDDAADAIFSVALPYRF